MEARVFQIALGRGAKLPHLFPARRTKQRESAELRHFETKGHVAEDCLVRKQRILLRNVTAEPIRLRSFDAVHQHAAACRSLFTEYQAQQSGFPTSGQSHNRYEFA